MLRFTRALPFALFALFACGTPAAGTDAGRDAGTDAGRSDDAGAPPACAEDTGEAVAVFSLPRAGDEPGTLFDLPWPNDLRRSPDGTLDMSSFPNPRRNPFVSRYLDAMSAQLDGFATNGPAYFRFSRAVDQGSLEAATAFLVDIDASSPERGTRHPTVLHYQDCPTLFWAAHTVSVRPVYGVPLAAGRRYAAVVTTGLRTDSGEPFGRDADFRALVEGSGDAVVEGARDGYGDALEVLAEAGVPTAEVLSLTVFTTQDPTAELLLVRDWMVSEFEAPAVMDGSVTVESVAPRYTQLDGRYGPSPIFQAGEVPYADEGGGLVVTAGVPTVSGTFDARFTVTVPSTPMPPDGYPIVLYAHGTGGDYRTVVRNGTAEALARRGIAAMGVDQIHHGDRNPTETDPAILFFNFGNPAAARDNTRQSALDIVQQRRLVPRLTFDTALVDRGGEAVRFDSTRVSFMGHSQGGLNGPLFLAMDDGVRGGVLSAASANIAPALIEKLEPLVIPDIVRALLNLPGADWEEAYALEGFTYAHPVATLLQTWLEVSDASNYAHLIVDAPRAGFAPKSVLMTEGLRDRFTPPIAIEALAGAMRIPQVEPVVRTIDAASLRAIVAVSPPVRGNAGGGAATAGLLQFPEDGHFAVFDNDAANAQVLSFLESLSDGPGTIAAPE